MCLAIPSRIVAMADEVNATVEVFGARKAVNLMLMPEAVGLGDYVLVHAGFAIQRVDEEAALDAQRLIREMAELLEAEGALDESPDAAVYRDMSNPLDGFGRQG